ARATTEEIVALLSDAPIEDEEDDLPREAAPSRHATVEPPAPRRPVEASAATASGPPADVSALVRAFEVELDAEFAARRIASPATVRAYTNAVRHLVEDL